MKERSGLEFLRDGAQLFEAAMKGFMAEVELAIASLPHDAAGVRIQGLTALRPLLETDGCIGAIAASRLGPRATPVRAILFNKSPDTNWSLGWHQDRTICVADKVDAPGYGPWTVKGDMYHVEPPFYLLSRMVTLRVHLDDVPAGNAPLLIARGSHKLGRISVGEVSEVVRRCGTAMCLAKAGDIWLYATPTLHASEATSAPTARRVLQVDYAAETLPHGLRWLGV